MDFQNIVIPMVAGTSLSLLNGYINYLMSKRKMLFLTAFVVTFLFPAIGLLFTIIHSAIYYNKKNQINS